jgi:hypothetical protein
MKVVHPDGPGQAAACDGRRPDREVARMNMHKNARLMPQGRLLLVQRVIKQGWTVRSAQAGYAVGSVDFLTLLSSLLTLQENRLELEMETAEHAKARARLEEISGELP